MTFIPLSAYADGDCIQVGAAQVRLKVSARASRISLRLDSTRREVVAIAPSPRRLSEAAAFARERQAWIEARLDGLPRPRPLAPGVTIEVLGRPCRLEQAAGRTAWKPTASGEPLRLAAAGEGEVFVRAVIRALKLEARRTLSERTEVYAERLGVSLPVVGLGDPRARWGSCRPPRRKGFGVGHEVGRIRYSWRLVLAPYAVMNYVAAHECAHLIEANHSPRFWAVVRELIGDPKPHRAWLRAHGDALHAFGVG